MLDSVVSESHVRSHGISVLGYLRKDLRKYRERFWFCVLKGDGCWEWVGSFHHGYGRFFAGGMCLQAARFAYIITYGDGGMKDEIQVCHHCDNPKCVRPDHLFLGTQRDNELDKIGKGRSGGLFRPAEGHSLTGLDWERVRRIRARCLAGESQYKVAKDERVTRGCVEHIVTNRTWYDPEYAVPAPRKMPLSDDVKKRVKEMATSGMRSIDIASELGIHRATVCRVLKRE
jgi:hypothetical protein